MYKNNGDKVRTLLSTSLQVTTLVPVFCPMPPHLVFDVEDEVSVRELFPWTTGTELVQGSKTTTTPQNKQHDKVVALL